MLGATGWTPGGPDVSSSGLPSISVRRSSVWPGYSALQGEIPAAVCQSAPTRGSSGHRHRRCASVARTSAAASARNSTSGINSSFRFMRPPAASYASGSAGRACSTDRRGPSVPRRTRSSERTVYSTDAPPSCRRSTLPPARRTDRGSARR